MAKTNQAVEDTVQQLKVWLSQLPLSPDDAVPAAQMAELENLLAAVWDDLVGDEGGMAADKLFGRMEDVRWRPPLLTFAIERHGSTVLGSTRATIQYWEVDLDKGKVILTHESRRQLYSMAPRVDIRGLAQDLAQKIVEGRRDDACLHWKGADQVRIVATEVLPGACQETQADRRRRLWKALEEILAPQGWRRDASARGGLFVRADKDV